MSTFGFVDFTHAGVEAGKLPVTPVAPKDRLGWANMQAASSKRLGAEKIQRTTKNTVW